MRNAPILFEKDETAFASNGICRLYDAISVSVSEEMNGLFECDFEYPVTGANFNYIQCGRIIYTTHDDTGRPQPFDIVSYSKPINGVVTFHAVHVSYRTSGIVAQAQNINSLADAFTAMAETAQPSDEMVFTFNADFTSTAYMAAFDNTPRSIRQLLGGIDGSVLDTYGGEYEFDRFNITLHQARGVMRDFRIRYGVNMLDFTDDTDYQGMYTSCIPYWKGADSTGAEVVVYGNRVDSGAVSYNGRNVCSALDLSDKFENPPTVSQLESLAYTLMRDRKTFMPHQSIKVDFVRLQDMGYEGLDNLLQCNLCDTITVEFPDYSMAGAFKIVKTVWDALGERYTAMELGTLSVSLADALGISNSLGGSSGGVSDDLNVRGDLNVGGDTAIVGGLTAGGLTVSGDASILGTLTVGGHSSAIGTVITDTNNNVSVATGGALKGTGCNVTLPAGTWIIQYYVAWQNTNGGTYKGIGLRYRNVGVTSWTPMTPSMINVQPIQSNSEVHDTLAGCVVVTSASTGTEYEINVRNSVAGTVNCYLRAVRLL